MPNPWFRYYSETLRDRKLERIARVTGQSKALIMGVWVTVLSLANDSPIPGALLLTEDIPLAVGDIAMETDIDEETITAILERFQAMQMLTIEDGVYLVCNWDKRQFKSDNSAERVRRFRERKAAEQDSERNDAVTFPVTLPSVSVSVSDSVSSEVLSSSEEVSPAEKPNGEAFAHILARWSELFPNRPHPTERNKALRSKALTRLQDPDFCGCWDAALVRMTRAGEFVKDGSWFTLNWFLENDGNWRKCADGNYDDKKPGSGPIKMRV